MGGVDTSIANEEFWSSVGYWILVGGLVGDIIVLVVPKHRERLDKVLAAFFTIVIIVGVAIEHRADAAISVLVSQGQQASGLRIAQLNTEAGDARRIAGEAEERAAKNEKEAADLRKVAEDERLARVKIEKKLAQRTLSPEGRMRLKSAMKAYAGQSVEASLADPVDNDTGKIMKELSLVLVSAGLNFSWDPRPLPEYLRAPMTGILIMVSPAANNTAIDAGKTLASSLNSEGLEILFSQAFVGPYPPKDDRIRMFIYRK